MIRSVSMSSRTRGTARPETDQSSAWETDAANLFANDGDRRPAAPQTERSTIVATRPRGLKRAPHPQHRRSEDVLSPSEQAFAAPSPGNCATLPEVMETPTVLRPNTDPRTAHAKLRLHNPLPHPSPPLPFHGLGPRPTRPQSIASPTRKIVDQSTIDWQGVQTPPPHTDFLRALLKIPSRRACRFHRGRDGLRTPVAGQRRDPRPLRPTRR